MLRFWKWILYVTLFTKQIAFITFGVGIIIIIVV